MVSIPAMLTGTVYRNERPLPRYVDDHFEHGSLFKSLRAGGYRVDSVTEKCTTTGKSAIELSTGCHARM